MGMPPIVIQLKYTRMTLRGLGPMVMSAIVIHLNYIVIHFT